MKNNNWAQPSEFWVLKPKNIRPSNAWVLTNRRNHARGFYRWKSIKNILRGNFWQVLPRWKTTGQCSMEKPFRFFSSGCLNFKEQKLHRKLLRKRRNLMHSGWTTSNDLKVRDVFYKRVGRVKIDTWLAISTGELRCFVIKLPVHLEPNDAVSPTFCCSITSTFHVFAKLGQKQSSYCGTFAILLQFIPVKLISEGRPKLARKSFDCNKKFNLLRWTTNWLWWYWIHFGYPTLHKKSFICIVCVYS